MTGSDSRWLRGAAPDDPGTTAERPGMPQAAPYPRMPGGGISRRPLHFIILADCSGGMKGEKIQALTQPAGKAALRLAIAIGRDARSAALDRFIGDPGVPVLVADSSEDIADRLVAASLAVSRMSEAGADRGAVARRLLGGPGNVPGG